MLKAAERYGIQLPRARCLGFCQKTSNLAREAVNCNVVFGRPLVGFFYAWHITLMRSIIPVVTKFGASS
jgi:hypothetical protein